MKTAFVRKILFVFVLITVVTAGTLYPVNAADDTAVSNGPALQVTEGTAQGVLQETVPGTGEGTEGTASDAIQETVPGTGEGTEGTAGDASGETVPGTGEGTEGTATDAAQETVPGTGEGTEGTATDTSEETTPDPQQQESVPEEGETADPESAEGQQDGTAGEQGDPEQTNDADTQESDPEKKDAAEKKADVLESDAETKEEGAEGEEKKEEPVTPTLTIEKKPTVGKYTVKVKGFPENISGMQAATWSSDKGKDDLSWHEMKPVGSGKTYAFTSIIRDFKAFGNEEVAVYTVDGKGKKHLLCQDSFSIKKPSSKSLSVTRDSQAGAFSVKLNGFTSEFTPSSVKVIVWRDKKSDAKTYTMKANGSEYECSNVRLSDFKGYTGEYHFRVSASIKNGLTKTLRNATCTVKQTDGKFVYADKYKGQQGKMQTTYVLSLKGAARSAGIKKVEFVVWPNGEESQKKTYKAKADKNGIYSAEVQIRDFKFSGKYKGEAYVTDQKGNRILIKKRTIMNVDGMTGGKVMVINRKPEKGTFQLVLRGNTAPSGMRNVQFKVWSRDDRQDQIIYQAEKQSNGDWVAKVNIKKHEYNIGKYHARTICEMGNGISITKRRYDFTYNAKNLCFEFKPSKGVRTIGIDNPTKTKNLKAAVWSENGGKNDLKWYKLQQNGNQWITTVNIFDHGDLGKYYVEFYSGKTLLGDESFTARQGENKKYGWYYESHNGETMKFYYVNNKRKTDLRGMVSGPYQVRVNRVCNTITIYAKDGNKGFIIPVKTFLCSVGIGECTPTGHFKPSVRARWHYFKTWGTWVQYAVKYTRHKFFHSVTCHTRSIYDLSAAAYSKLGNQASHGCIRMTVEGAKWIYDHKGVCQDVWIFDSNDAGPFGKPAALQPQWGNGGYYDPTDPAV